MSMSVHVLMHLYRNQIAFSRDANHVPPIDHGPSFGRFADRSSHIKPLCNRNPTPGRSRPRLEQLRYRSIALALSLATTASLDGYTCTVSEDEVKANADFMAKNLKIISAFNYVVIDYEWFRPGTGQFGCCGSQPWENLVIDDYGRLQPCPLRYPSSKGGKGFKPLADYVHNLGLKFGIHIMRGIPRIATKKNFPIYKSNYTAQDATDQSTPCSW